MKLNKYQLTAVVCIIHCISLPYSCEATVEKSQEIGSSNVRTKRNKEGVEEHASRAEEDALASAAESVAAADNSIAAGIEIAQARLENVDIHPKSYEDVDKTYHTSYKNEIDNDDIDDNDNGEQSYDSEHRLNNEKKSSSASSSDETNRICDVTNFHDDSQLKRMIVESSGRATELKTIFDIISKREEQLVDEMQRLKSALEDAVSIIKSKDKDSLDLKKRMRREFFENEGTPYKACVSIVPSNENIEEDHTDNSNSHPEYPPEPYVREFIPDETDKHNVLHSASDAHRYHESGNNGDNINLSKVYWVKLPGKMNDTFLTSKVHSVFSEVTGDGMDALIIPVSRSFKSGQQVSHEFLRALHPKRRLRREVDAGFQIKEA